jgi:hypothetical protein
VNDREARLARNEALFRGVNEKVKEVRQDGEADDPIDFICECGSADCVEEVSLRPSEYEQVRSLATQFFVVPGHEILDVERVVETTDRYVVVEKHPEESTVARATDPRS